MSETQQSQRFAFGEGRDEIDKAIDNIEWAKKATSNGDILKANAHLHRAKELLNEYRETEQ